MVVEQLVVAAGSQLEELAALVELVQQVEVVPKVVWLWCYSG